MFSKEISKWSGTVSTCLSSQLAYKVNFLIVVIAPALVALLVNYNIWNAVYSYNHLETLRGFSMAKMLEYQCWVLIVALLAHSHHSRNLSEEIRLGRVTAFLLYPFEFWKFQTAAFLALELTQIFVCGFTLIVLLLSGLIPEISLPRLLNGVAVCFAVALLWYSFEYLFGLVAFWLEDTWVFRVVFEIFALFLSGSVIPLDFFPDRLRAFLAYTPFPLLTSVPVQIFMGDFQGSLTFTLISTVFWIGVVSTIAGFVWQRGMRLYTAAGM